MRFQFEDRSVGTTGQNERRTCTVNALAIAANVPWEVAHAALASVGRKRGRGCKSWHVLPKLHGKDGWLVQKVNLDGSPLPFRWQKRVTLAKFLRTHPTGRYYVTKRSHAFAIVDGQVRDAWTGGHGARTLIRDAWKISKDSFNETGQQLSNSAQL